MKTLKEVFATNPDLLKEKEVIELTTEFKNQFAIIKKRHFDYYDKVTELTLNSELFVIDGLKCEDVINKINEIKFIQ